MKATKFWEISSSTLLLSTVQSKNLENFWFKVEISQNFVAFSEYMNFNSKFSQNQHDLKVTL